MEDCDYNYVTNDEGIDLHGYEEVDEDEIDAPVEMPDSVNLATLPERSVEVYKFTYNKFMEWKKENLPNDALSEKLLLMYFAHLSESMKPNSLWSRYSMLRTTLAMYHENVNLADYNELKAFIKVKNQGYAPPKAKMFPPEVVDDFLKNAPDDKYLDSKVVCIFQVLGGMGCNELTNLTVEDIETHGAILLVRIPETKKPRSFVVPATFVPTVTRYKALRQRGTPTNRFLVNFQKGRCTKQVIGKNKLRLVPKKIAEYSGLPEPEKYTGHSFRQYQLKTTNSITKLLSRSWSSPSTSAKESTAAPRSPADPFEKPTNTFEEKIICEPLTTQTYEENVEVKEVALSQKFTLKKFTNPSSKRPTTVYQSCLTTIGNETNKDNNYVSVLPPNFRFTNCNITINNYRR